VADFTRIIDKVCPDLIHVHGTETTIGQVVEHTQVPVVVSLQGFISESYEAVLGGLPQTTWRCYRSLREATIGGGFPLLSASWQRSARGEVRVFTKNRHFIGRTAFDLEVLRKHNPSARYYRGREMLREEFLRGSWDADTCDPRRIYCPGFSNPLKGFHVLLDAVGLLMKDFPDVLLCTPGQITPRSQSPLVGNAYHRYLAATIAHRGLTRHVTFLGRLDGPGVFRELTTAGVFAVSSLIENSSNALGEALAVGCPAVVANPCGGLQSLLGPGEVAVSYTQGDAADLAAAISTVFRDRALAARLSMTAKRLAVDLHGPEGIAEEYLAIYDQVVDS
jgi:glycosyltransferase involved in cell wall biosynthesis